MRVTATEAGPTPSDRTVLVALVRHGESLWNAEKRYQGQTGTGLSPRGTAQASAAADYLLRMFPRFDIAISSDLQRVVETADAFESRSGMAVKRDSQWREIDTGAWSGLTFAQVAEAYPEEVAAARRGEDIPRGGGETFAQLRARITEALLALAAHARPDGQPETRVVVFTHGGPIRVGAAAALGLPQGGHFSLAAAVNCSVTAIRLHLSPSGDAESMTLAAYNSPTSPPNVGAVRSPE